MGVPSLFRWLNQKYPKIITPVIEHHEEEIDGVKVPVDATKPNPNGEEFDNLYLDMNAIVHPCAHPEGEEPPPTEAAMMLKIFEYTERLVKMVRPRKLLMFAVDGVAPRAKMNQQRARRFRSAQEAKEKDEDNEKFLREFLKKSKGEVADALHERAAKKTWDSNAITPGTPFMHLLAASLRYWTALKVNTDPAWRDLKVIISDAAVPGEGEHKIMEFIRSQRSSPEHDPNTRHIMYGLDADLIMLGLTTHEPHFRILREDVFHDDRKPRTCRICGQTGHYANECRGEAKKKQGEFDEKDGPAEPKPFIWLHVSILREYLAAELYVPAQPFPMDLERAIDDWVFMCFFVGNDFLPHLPSLDIKEQGIDTLMAIWRDNIPTMGGYVTRDGRMDLAKAQIILEGLAKQEHKIFQNRREKATRQEAAYKRRKLEDAAREIARNGNQNNGTPKGRKGQVMDPIHPPEGMEFYAPGRGETLKDAKPVTYASVVNKGTTEAANVDNRSAAARLKSQLLSAKSVSDIDLTDTPETDANSEPEATPSTPLAKPGKRKADLMEEDLAADSSVSTPKGKGEDEGEEPVDNVKLWEAGYEDRYYEQKFKVDPQDIAFRNKVARSYCEGLAWVLLYYMQGCPSMTWFYPYHYAPFAADFVDLTKMDIKFERGKPFRPYEQLMGVLPAASQHAIPEAFRPLMTDPDSEIIDFYPEDFAIDLNGKKFSWQAVALLPFIDEKRLLDAMATRYHLLSDEEVSRNELGNDVLIISDQHKMATEINTALHSKKKASAALELDPSKSDGFTGKVHPDPSYIPGSSLIFPLEEGEETMPQIDIDHSISVFYTHPPVNQQHKSMLLRGVRIPPPSLNEHDIQMTKTRAGTSGRSFGRDDNYHPRGGRNSYGGGHDYQNNSYQNGRGRGGRGGGRGGGGGYHNGGDQQNGHQGYDNRPNPFAAYVNPQHPPPPMTIANGRGPPQPMQGYQQQAQGGYYAPLARGGYNGGGGYQGGGGRRGGNYQGQGHGGYQGNGGGYQGNGGGYQGNGRGYQGNNGGYQGGGGGYQGHNGSYQPRGAYQGAYPQAQYQRQPGQSGYNPPGNPRY